MIAVRQRAALRSPAALAPSTEWITVTELQERLVRGHTVLLDALSPEEYQDAHLPGALNLSSRVRKHAPALIPDRSADIVVYGANSRSEEGRRLVDRLRALGYANVRILAGGKQHWARSLLPLVSVGDEH